MSVRIGVDVGGTFTKAVACAAETGEVLARSIVPTSHQAPAGVADGAIQALGEVAEDVAARELGPIQLVAHSTTQAVNALLEGDTSVVGVLGIGRRPDVKRARRRTAVGQVRLAPGRKLVTRHSFIDASGGLERAQIVAAIQELVDEGAEVLCISEAFGVEDARSEWLALEVAEDLGVPACAGHELTGLYGLEMRTVTGALNASILPTALRTARMVEEAVARDIPGVPLLVMRGDGGAVGIQAMKRHPLLTAFSGPAASVAGALHHVEVHGGVVVEVGGTSSNISTIKGGRPILSYIRVLDHVTCVRSVDVRVVGVAGGSLLRIARRMGRPRLIDVGPRSAHIAGLPYACFSTRAELTGATPALIAPRPGDPAEYLVLETRAGRRVAITLTCAANALGEVTAGSYAEGNADAAMCALEIVANWLGTDVRSLAGGALKAAATKIGGAVKEAAAEQSLVEPQVIGLGGGAGALMSALGHVTGLPWSIPREAEVISSVGDALSLVRVEVERTLPRATAEAVAAVHSAAEEAALGAGAAPHTIQLESEAVPERGALRVVAYGSASLEAGDGAIPLNGGRKDASARSALGEAAREVATNPFYSVYVDGTGGDRAFAVIDRVGAVVAEGSGTVLTGVGAEVAAAIEERVPALVRHFGPIAVAPALRIIRGARVIDLTLISDPDAAVEAALAECSLAHEEPVVALLSRA
ncbi:MAG TPA: hydantoinase/oxoprolinase family protein [Actinomycetota bacterium]|nr:hydantoinase/oxoprolinase family protein [Actinomycetota bacterium]